MFNIALTLASLRKIKGYMEDGHPFVISMAKRELGELIGRLEKAEQSTSANDPCGDLNEG